MIIDVSESAGFQKDPALFIPQTTQNLGKSSGGCSRVTIYGDGASSPTMKIGGWGYIVVVNGKVVHRESGGEFNTTNNRMEIIAMLSSLRWIVSQDIKNFMVHSDSQYVVKAVMEGWIDFWGINGWRNSNGDQVANIDLWTEVAELLSKMRVAKVTYRLEWVRGHSGNIYNEFCDELAVAEKMHLISRINRHNGKKTKHTKGIKARK